VSTHAAPLRRRPVQQRSTQRVERMLAACASLVDEVGYDGVTTTLIAERAGVAVGSLYQFFPDKRAVVQALTSRNLDRFMATVVDRFSTTRLEHWWHAVDTVIDVYLTMHREVPGFAKLHFGDVVDFRLLDDRRDNNTVVAERLATLIATQFDIRAEDLQLPIAVAVEAADGVLKLAFRRDARGDDEVINEAKQMIKGYLSTRLGEPQ
jgi:AcrR family transcriptional regulator